MRVSSGMVLVVLALSAIIPGASLAADEVKTETQTLLVKYSDGTTERHIVKYTAFFEGSRWESGKPSTWKHPVDDRQCHWSMHAYVERDIGMVDHSGHTSWRNEWHRVFDQPIVNRAPGLGIKTGFQGVNCGRVGGDIDGQMAALRDQVADSLPNIMDGDRKEVANELQGDGQVVNISQQ